MALAGQYQAAESGPGADVPALGDDVARLRG